MSNALKDEIRRDDKPFPALRWWLISFAGAFLIFGGTTAPDVLMIADSGQYQVWTYLFPDLPLSPKPPDLVRLHLPYYFFAKVFGWIPFGTYAWRINILSAFCGALTVANVVTLAQKFSTNKHVALFAGIVVCFGHTLWAFAVAAEVLTMMSACITFELLLWARYDRTRRPTILLWIALLNGFGTAIHHQIGLNTIVYFVAVAILAKKKLVRPAYLLAWPTVWALGSLPDLAVLAHYVAKTQDLPFMLKSYAVGVFGEDMANLSPRLLKRVLAAFALNYPTGLILFLLPGIRDVLRPNHPAILARVLVAVAGLQFLFPLTYAVADQYSFFVPFYALSGIAIALGAARWLSSSRFRGALFTMAILPICAYWLAPEILRTFEVGAISSRAPYHNPNEFFLRPWKHNNYGQRQYIEEAFSQLPENAVYLSRQKIAYLLSYGQTVEGRRRDLELNISPMGLKELLDWEDPDQTPRWRKPVYTSGPTLVPQHLNVQEHCDFHQEGIIWRVSPPRDPEAWLRDIQIEIDKMKSKM